MSPIVLVIMGMMTAALIAAIVWIGAAFIAPPDKARRAGLAALLGGTVGFTTTALVQGPFYNNAGAQDVAMTPLVLAMIGAIGMALLAAWMILKANVPPAPPPSE